MSCFLNISAVFTIALQLNTTENLTNILRTLFQKPLPFIQELFNACYVMSLKSPKANFVQESAIVLFTSDFHLNIHFSALSVFMANVKVSWLVYQKPPEPLSSLLVPVSRHSSPPWSCGKSMTSLGQCIEEIVCPWKGP